MVPHAPSQPLNQLRVKLVACLGAHLAGGDQKTFLQQMPDVF